MHVCLYVPVWVSAGICIREGVQRSENNILFFTQAGCSFPSLISSQFLLPPPLFSHHQPTPSLFLFRKGQAFYGHQQNITYKVTVRLNMLPCIMAGQGDPVREIGTQKLLKESEIAPVLPVRSPTRGSCYTYTQSA